MTDDLRERVRAAIVGCPSLAMPVNADALTDAVLEALSKWQPKAILEALPPDAEALRRQWQPIETAPAPPDALTNAVLEALQDQISDLREIQAAYVDAMYEVRDQPSDLTLAEKIRLARASDADQPPSLAALGRLLRGFELLGMPHWFDDYPGWAPVEADGYLHRAWELGLR